MDLTQGKVLITGGSMGIGRETARLLLEAGAQVAICARGADALNKTAEDLGALPIQVDVSDPAQATAMVDKVVETFGGYNVLVNNAAYGYFAPLTDIDLDRFEKQIATNLTGAMLVAQASARHFVTRNTGNIINISSTAGLKGFAGGTPYAATKFALGAMTECWRAELRKHNIRVMQINPSEVLTEFAANAGYDQQASERKLRATEIAHMVKAVLEMDDRGFVTDLTVFATNPTG
jgi:3-oxoacyl-[acyl-carrier protein] reductase